MLAHMEFVGDYGVVGEFEEVVTSKLQEQHQTWLLLCAVTSTHSVAGRCSRSRVVHHHQLLSQERNARAMCFG